MAIDTSDLSQAEAAPVQRIVRPGRHTIFVQKEGYLPVNRVVEIQPGEQSSVFVDLRPAPRYGRSCAARSAQWKSGVGKTPSTSTAPDSA